MKTYLIERHMPGAGKMSPDELRAASKQSVGVLSSLGDGIRWLHSYVIDDHIYCVYQSSSVELIVEHARCMGIPADRISEIHSTISPAAATA